MNYCTPGDVYSHGVPPGAVANPARPPSSVDVASSAFVLGDHGLTEGDEVSFRAEAGGTMPSPLLAGVVYFARVLDDHRFSVAATLDGPAIVLTTAGSRLLVMPRLPMMAAIAFASRVLDDQIPAQLLPKSESEVPEILRMTAAEIAAGKLAARAGSETRTLGSIVDAAQKRVDRWARGIPLRGPNAPAKANLATSSAALPLRDPSGWQKFGGL